METFFLLIFLVIVVVAAFFAISERAERRRIGQYQSQQYRESQPKSDPLSEVHRTINTLVEVNRRLSDRVTALENIVAALKERPGAPRALKDGNQDPRAAQWLGAPEIRIARGELFSAPPLRTTPAPTPAREHVHDFVDRWNALPWPNATLALEEFAAEVQRMGLRMSDDIRATYRLVWGEQGVMFLYPYLRKDVDLYDIDFFERPPSGTDSIRLIRAAQVRTKTGLSPDLDLTKFAGSFRMTDIFEPVQRGEIA